MGGRDEREEVFVEVGADELSGEAGVAKLLEEGREAVAVSLWEYRSIRRNAMKLALILFVLATFTSALAQTPNMIPTPIPTAASIPTLPPEGPVPSSCGPMAAKFKVSFDKSQHTLAQPEPGKALIYFIYEPYYGSRDPIMLGIDGAWVGANYHGYSYSSISVDPGERHICAGMSYYIRVEQHLAVGLAHLQVEAGKIYFYRIRDDLRLDPMDSDEGKYLIGFYPLSVSRPNPKK